MNCRALSIFGIQDIKRTLGTGNLFYMVWSKRNRTEFSDYWRKNKCKRLYTLNLRQYRPYTLKVETTKLKVQTKLSVRGEKTIARQGNLYLQVKCFHFELVSFFTMSRRWHRSTATASGTALRPKPRRNLESLSAGMPYTELGRSITPQLSTTSSQN